MPAIVLPQLANSQGRDTRVSFIDARLDPSTGTPMIELLGDDNESLTRDIAWDTTSTRVVTGRISVTSTISEQTMSIDPFYFRDNENIGLMLLHFDEQGLEGDAVRRFYYEAKFDSTGTFISAFKMNAVINVTSVGGDAATPDSATVELVFDNVKIPQSFTQSPTGEFTFADITTP